MKVAALILTMFLASDSAAGQVLTVKNNIHAQLTNQNFVMRAPIDKVTELRGRSAELEHQINTLNNNLEALG
ncbi:MAG: hypothetical protein JNL64_02675 [Blastocatellia bacterium]|nr:hypothetical protein [Blastocatellia bacterium]